MTIHTNSLAVHSTSSLRCWGIKTSSTYPTRLRSEEALVQHNNDPNADLDGTPAEMSLYGSLQEK